MKIEHLKKILFLGIGGIGMSALAKYFIAKGIQVYGYDKTASDMTSTLKNLGAEIAFEDNELFTYLNYDLVIYTPAMPSDSFLLKYYKQSSTPLMKRSQALGFITQNAFTIAVSGSHGKTTVSTMIAYILKESGIDCSAFLGGVSVNFQSNYVQGTSNIVVVEADEYDRSFMTLSPNIIVLTSIDTDHLDIYGTRENIVGAFSSFFNKLEDKGILIHSEKVKDKINIKGEIKSYGFDSATLKATNIEIFSTHSTFNINHGIEKFKLNYNGRHNIENALAAISVGIELGLSIEKMANSLDRFKGIKRRFEIILQNEQYTFIDDYAHHPAEIDALLNSIREIFPSKKILSIFQPHLFTRTKDLCVDFAEALDNSDEVFLLPIFPARELPIAGVTSEIISSKMKTNVSLIEKENLIHHLDKSSFDIILTIGAGDINLYINKIKSYLIEN